MDTTRPIAFRGVQLNTLALPLPGGATAEGLSGVTVDEADISSLDIDQAIEKRAQAEGLDVGEVFMGGRQVRLAGTTYGSTRALLFDALHALRRAMNARHAYLADEDERGFHALSFSVPTDDRDSYPDGVIEQVIYVSPRNFSYAPHRDRLGGRAGQPLAVPWRVLLLARDPMIYAADAQSVDVTVGASGVWHNRGDFAVSVYTQFTVGTGSGTASLTINGVTTTITIEAGTDGRVITYDGAEKTLTVAEPDGEPALRMDLLTLGDDEHPLVPVGFSGYTFSRSASATAGTTNVLRFTEAYA